MNKGISDIDVMKLEIFPGLDTFKYNYQIPNVKFISERVILQKTGVNFMNKGVNFMNNE